MKRRIIQNLLHKELSYQIHGAAIEVRKDFGPGHKEKLYQEAFAQELKRHGIAFEKEVAIKIYSPKDGKYIGLYRPDFIIDGKVIIELKAVEKVPKMFLDQLYSYLRNSSYELGYFVNFASPKLYIKRIIFTNDRKSFLKNISCLLVFLFVSFSVFTLKAQAAEISFDTKTNAVAVGQQFQVSVVLDTNGEEINAIEGRIIFPGDLLELKDVSDANSIINFWVEKPQIDTNKNTNKHEIVFGGITPGGYQGESGLIFSVIFKAKKEGGALIEITNAKTLLNDGKGTETKTMTKNLLVSIRADISSPSWVSPKDNEPPESFVPEIATEPIIFEGKHFLVFATQDKKSGILHYEVKEARQRIFDFSTPLETSRLGRLPISKWISKWIGFLTGSNWVEAESPYVLQDQKLRSYVFVKAVDKAGNERIVKVLPQNPLKWYENYENWIMIIVGIALIFYITRKVLQRKYLH